MGLAALIRKPKADGSAELVAPSEPVTLEERQASPMFQFVKAWASRSKMLRRVIESAKAEIRFASRDMEVESGTVIESFRDVASKAESQSQRISDIAGMATKVSVDGEEIELGRLAQMFDDTLDDILSKIGTLSQHAFSMVGSLEGMSKNLEQVEGCITSVETINRQANMLAVNARIEAARTGGSAGEAFSVIANEIGQLSHTTKSLSGTMRQHMGEVIGAIRSSHDALKEVACVDMSSNIEMRWKLDKLVGSMMERGVGLSAIVSTAAFDQGQISDRINKIITSMQFQDRVTQRLEQVLDTLTVVCDAVGDLQEESGEAAADSEGYEAAGDVEWLKGLSARYKLSEMRARFITRVIDGVSHPADEETASMPAQAGSIELF